MTENVNLLSSLSNSDRWFLGDGVFLNENHLSDKGASEGRKGDTLKDETGKRYNLGPKAYVMHVQFKSFADPSFLTNF